MKAVRFIDPAGKTRVGALEDDRVRDAGAAGPRGVVPSPETWDVVADAPNANRPRHDQAQDQIGQQIRRRDPLCRSYHSGEHGPRQTVREDQARVRKRTA